MIIKTAHPFLIEEKKMKCVDLCLLDGSNQLSQMLIIVSFDWLRTKMRNEMISECR